MADLERRDQPRLGPWLSRYARQEQRSTRERLTEFALGAAAGIVFLVLAAGVLWLFIRYPFPVLGGLAGVWLIGFVMFMIVNRRARDRERMLHQGSLFDELRRARREKR